MNHEKLNAQVLGQSSIGKQTQLAEAAHASGFYTVECIDIDGNVVWKDTIRNLVTTQGKNDALDKYLSGSAYTAAWYLGLISATGYTAIVAADTAASHTGWTEDQAYTQAARPTAAFSVASAGSKALSSALVFTANASTTIKGCFLASVATKGGITGILYSAGLFSGGDQPVVSTNTLNVTYTASL